jgi:hypothetical protein
MEVACSSETSVDFQWSTQQYISLKTKLFMTTAMRTLNPWAIMFSLLLVAHPTGIAIAW